MRSRSYIFIYDDFLNERKYERQLAQIEARLAELDLQGRVARLSALRSAKDLVMGMLSPEISTLVVVGNDRTLDKVMNFLPDLNLPVGYIPVMAPTGIAELLGIPVGVEACDALAARLLEPLDVGRVDDQYFFTEISLPQTMASVDIEGRYRIAPMRPGSIVVRNLGRTAVRGKLEADPRDGKLEVIIETDEGSAPKRFWSRQKTHETRILIESGRIFSSDVFRAEVDAQLMQGKEFRVEIVPKKLRMITGRGRRHFQGGGLPNSERIATLPTTNRDE